MINVTSEFKIESIKNRNYFVTADCVLSDGTQLKLKKGDFYNSGNGIVDSSDSSDFPIGIAIEKTATLTLVNDDDRFSGYNFNAARFTLYLNLNLSERSETIKRGTFIVSKKPATAEKIRLTLMDHMSLADREYETNLIFPCTAGELLLDACQTCGIMLGDTEFTNSDYQITKKPENTTHRAVIGAVSALAGGNARVDEDDYLRIVTFDKEFVTENVVYDGGDFKGYSQSDVLDGGTMNPWTGGEIISGGTFEEQQKYHTLFYIKNLKYDTDDVIVTGVKYAEDEQEYMVGTDGYIVTLDNILLHGNIEDGLNRIGEQIIGLQMRPFSCSSIANAYATFGDSVEIVDVKGRRYKSYLTNVDFLFNGYTTFSCTAKSAEEIEKEYTSQNQTTIEQAKKETEKKLSAYDIAVQHMNQLAANTLGFYYSQEKQEDGSIISYRHDKPTLEESEIIYKSGTDGFFLSVDGGETWKAGFDSNGDAVLNILYAIGIQAEWINTRGLTAKDNEGNITIRVDADTGRVDIVAESFQLRGKTIEELAQEKLNDFVSSTFNDTVTNLQAQIDGQIETFYYDYEPTLANEPASTWETDIDKTKHEGDLFYWKSKGFSYRFMKDGDSWKWQLVQDTDITKAMEQAANAKDTADGKRRVFISTPTPPYDPGDLWATSTEDGKASIKICKSGRAAGVFSSADWIDPKYVDSTDVDGAIADYDSDLDQMAVFNKLTNNGISQGIFVKDGKIWINGEFIKALSISADALKSKSITSDKISVEDLFAIAASIGGWLIRKGYIESEDGTIKLYSDGRINIGNANIQSDGKSFMIKHGLHVYAGTEQFSDGSDQIKFFNLSHVTSGGHLVFAQDGSTVSYLSSSSKRYKDHVDYMTTEEAQKLLEIPVVWFKYKDGYLNRSDRFVGKPMPGFYAEDVYEKFPEAAQINQNGEPEDWNYRTIIPAMLKLIQDQKNTIDNLNERTEKLEQIIRGEE